jgi:class III cytochrome C family protein
MRNRIVISATVLVFVAAAAIAAFPTTVKIAAAAKKQPAVTFDHAKHTQKLVKSCDVCHHTQKGLKKEQAGTIEVKKCSTCHLDPKGTVPSMREMAMAKNPFHIRCIACHKEAKKGPVLCTGCHKKA